MSYAPNFQQLVNMYMYQPHVLDQLIVQGDQQGQDTSVLRNVKAHIQGMHQRQPTQRY